jgi:hypothetical protein
MVGNFPEPPKRNSDSVKPKIKSFTCTNCGAAIEVRFFGTSLSCVCPACHSSYGLENGTYTLLHTYLAKLSQEKMLIPLGTRGKLFDKEWEVIGFIVRKVLLQPYSWQEYLLFNPYYGYRWLIQNDGHWNFATPIKNNLNTSNSSVVKFDEQRFSLFNSDTVEVAYVVGEFYWLVNTGQIVSALDYINPPLMLSCEQNDQEINWTLCEYVEPNVIKQAFSLKTSLPWKKGIGPNQPLRQKGAMGNMILSWFIFVLILSTLQTYKAANSLNAQVFEKNYYFETSQKTADNTTPTFNLTKADANLELNLYANVDNSWFYVAGELVNDKTGKTYPFEKSIEYYHGYDSDGSWTEGSHYETVRFNHVEAGPYYINFDTESSGGNSSPILLDPAESSPDKLSTIPGANDFKITAKRDVPQYLNFFWFLLLVSIPPAFTWWSTHADEVKRWSNSDFSPYGDD